MSETKPKKTISELLEELEKKSFLLEKKKEELEEKLIKEKIKNTIKFIELLPKNLKKISDKDILELETLSANLIYKIK